ncbi:MAG TPA: hypothetical protein VN030_05600 [Cellvibrio sp.]|nr:hypothetical protein [Cellvibrio sp.]
MTDSNFKNSLSIILGELGKKDWATPLLQLAERFNCIPAEEYSFEHELLNMLHNIHSAISTDNSLPLAQLVAIRLSALECWTFRFFHIEAGSHHKFLNPLTDSTPSFKHTYLQINLANSAFPSTDIIKRWARENLR